MTGSLTLHPHHRRGLYPGRSIYPGSYTYPGLGLNAESATKGTLSVTAASDATLTLTSAS